MLSSFIESNIRGAGNTLDQKLAAGESFGTAFLKDSLAKGRDFESKFEGLRDKQRVDIANTGGEQRRVAAGANSSVQQKFQTVRGRNAWAGNLEQTLRRGKARQGIVNRGDNAIKNQQLKDRLAVTKQSIGRRGQLQQTSADAARLRAGIDVAQQDANSRIGSAYSGAAGAVAGGLVSGFGDKLFGGGGGIDPVTDQGTAAGDWNNSMDTGSGFDFNNINGSGGVLYG